MIYFDTNVYLYAFSKNVDNKVQQQKSIKILEESLRLREIIVSEVILYEYAFVAKKLGESQDEIDKYLDFLKRFIKPSFNVYERVLEIMSKKDVYKSSFDVFHLAFSEYYGCKEFITFDKGFKRFKDLSKTQIVIL